MALLTRRDVLAAPLLAAAAPASRPSILVVVLDDLGCRDLGFLGAKDLQTPHFDRLAQGGAVCTNWYSNAPVCAPARASILSGRYPANAGVPTNGGQLLQGMPTLGSVARAAGYRTAAIGKWHLGGEPHSHPNGAGFDYFYGFLSGCVDYYSHRFYWGDPARVNFHDLQRNGEEVFEDGRYLTERITEETVGFLEKNRTQPFCAYVAYNAPHYPMHAPEKYQARFPSLPPERRTYAAMVAAVDDGIGAIRATLERQGRWNDTLLLFVGDNGATTEKRAGLNQQYAAAGSNGVFRGYKFSLFDGGMHVPAVVHWPARIRPGTRVTECVQSMDILPTICRAAGLTPPAGLDGSDALDVIASGARSPHETLLWDSGGQAAARRGKWKLVINGRVFGPSDTGGAALKGDDALWLSDLEADPGETRNLRTANPALVDELASLVYRWQQTLRKN